MGAITTWRHRLIVLPHTCQNCQGIVWGSGWEWYKDIPEFWSSISMDRQGGYRAHKWRCNLCGKPKCAS